ncbi:MAG: nucleotidyltransferase domain-containing protein [Kiritimatiellae bacterium]|nr:nucleotidyltransferase domain-containing protein [Kiritimatiellia bacterium]
MTREEQIAIEIKDVVDTLASEYEAERVILFGSRANGQTCEESDVDLVVIKETALGLYDRLKEVARLCRWTHAFEILVYTSEEFAQMSQKNSFIREEIIEKGKVLYERVA